LGQKRKEEAEEHEGERPPEAGVFELDEIYDKKKEIGDGKRVDGAARESQKQCREKNKDERKMGRGGSYMHLRTSEEVERVEGGGEQEIAHKLRLNGEAGGMREAKRKRGATKAEKSRFARDAINVE